MSFSAVIATAYSGTRLDAPRSRCGEAAFSRESLAHCCSKATLFCFCCFARLFAGRSVQLQAQIGGYFYGRFALGRGFRVV